MKNKIHFCGAKQTEHRQSWNGFGSASEAGGRETYRQTDTLVQRENEIIPAPVLFTYLFNYLCFFLCGLRGTSALADDLSENINYGGEQWGRIGLLDYIWPLALIFFRRDKWKHVMAQIKPTFSIEIICSSRQKPPNKEAWTIITKSHQQRVLCSQSN